MKKISPHQKHILTPKQFTHRLTRYFGYAMILINSSLAIGVIGYHFLGELNWIDSLLNASMILGGMGPVNTITTVSGKLFSSVYAIFSGIIFLTSVGIFLSPIAHRIMHVLHVEDEDLQENN